MVASILFQSEADGPHQEQGDGAPQHPRQGSAGVDVGPTFFLFGLWFGCRLFEVIFRQEGELLLERGQDPVSPGLGRLEPPPSR